MNAIIPIPKIPITIRPAAMDDIPFIDSLQKKHTKQVGWFPTKTIEGKIKAGHVIVAEEGARGEGQGASENQSLASDPFLSLAPRPMPLAPIGYLIGNDQYFKHDDIGIIYQINIAEGKRRSLIGATLLKAQFERSAYGCKLYCCWCAQDIEANRFWESMGFVPLAFRTGSRSKGPKTAGKAGPRVHIFWQKRIRSGDATTPWWFPSQTSSGAIREDRLVLPIPPGIKWSDAMPIVLPAGELSVASGQLPGEGQEQKRLPAPRAKRVVQRSSKYAIARSQLHFVVPKPVKTPKEKLSREKRTAVKNDPKLIAAARELRDRWLEQVNDGEYLIESQGKYEVSRALDAAPIRIQKAIGDDKPIVRQIAA